MGVCDFACAKNCSTILVMIFMVTACVTTSFPPGEGEVGKTNSESVVGEYSSVALRNVEKAYIDRPRSTEEISLLFGWRGVNELESKASGTYFFDTRSDAGVVSAALYTNKENGRVRISIEFVGGDLFCISGDDVVLVFGGKFKPTAGSLSSAFDASTVTREVKKNRARFLDGPFYVSEQGNKATLFFVFSYGECLSWVHFNY